MRSAAAAVLPFAALASGAVLQSRALKGFTFPSELSIADIDEWRDQLEPAFDHNPSEQIPDPLEALSKRQDDFEGYTTNIGLGDVQTDFGCDQSIREILHSAIISLCNGGICNGGRSYTQEVAIELEHFGSTRTADVVVDIRGSYNGNVRHHLIQAIEETVNPDTVGSYDHTYSYNGAGEEWMGKCRMSAFSNYVALVRRKPDGGMVDELQIDISLDLGNDAWCHAAAWTGTVVGTVSGLAGGFFGLVSAHCGMQSD